MCSVGMDCNYPNSACIQSRCGCISGFTAFNGQCSKHIGKLFNYKQIVEQMVKF